MSSYAYIDKLKTTYVLADNCTANDINKVFYCPDPNCDCVVRLVSYNSNKRKAHFRGTDYSHQQASGVLGGAGSIISYSAGAFQK